MKLNFALVEKYENKHESLPPSCTHVISMQAATTIFTSSLGAHRKERVWYDRKFWVPGEHQEVTSHLGRLLPSSLRSAAPLRVHPQHEETERLISCECRACRRCRRFPSDIMSQVRNEAANAESVPASSKRERHSLRALTASERYRTYLNESNLFFRNKYEATYGPVMLQPTGLVKASSNKRGTTARKNKAPPRRGKVIVGYMSCLDQSPATRGTAEG